MDEKFTLKELRMIKDLMEKEVVVSFGLDESAVRLHDKVCEIINRREKQFNKSDGVVFDGSNR